MEREHGELTQTSDYPEEGGIYLTFIKRVRKEGDRRKFEDRRFDLFITYEEAALIARSVEGKIEAARAKRLDDYFKGVK